MISKIENSEGLKNADEICKYSDAIMIDRGDLSAEIGENYLYEAILKITNLTKKYGKPLIMATDNLETMSKSNNPSKNDIISLGFSNQINSDVIMLSEETASSNKWKNIITWLSKFLIIRKYNLDFNKSYKIASDLDFIIKCFYKSLDYEYINKSLIIQRSGGTSQKFINILKANYEVFKICKKNKIRSKIKFIIKM